MFRDTQQSAPCAATSANRIDKGNRSNIMSVYLQRRILFIADGRERQTAGMASRSTGEWIQATEQNAQESAWDHSDMCTGHCLQNHSRQGRPHWVITQPQLKSLEGHSSLKQCNMHHLQMLTISSKASASNQHVDNKHAVLEETTILHGGSLW